MASKTVPVGRADHIMASINNNNIDLSKVTRNLWSYFNKAVNEQKLTEQEKEPVEQALRVFCNLSLWADSSRGRALFLEFGAIGLTFLAIALVATAIFGVFHAAYGAYYLFAFATYIGFSRSTISNEKKVRSELEGFLQQPYDVRINVFGKIIDIILCGTAGGQKTKEEQDEALAGLLRLQNLCTT